MTDKIIVLTTCGSKKEAKQIARHLLETRLAACVTIQPEGRSVYRWADNIEDAKETLLLIKTRRDLFDQVRVEIEKSHNYDVPEVVAVPIVAGSEAYLGWLENGLQPSTPAMASSD